MFGPSEIQSFFRGYAAVLEDEEVRAISRRYFIANGFDMTLTTLGVVLGAYLSGVGSGLTVVKVAFGAGVGLTTSAVWSVWEIERAEKRSEIRSLENAMLTDLSETRLRRRRRRGQVINALASGLGPVVGITPALWYLFGLPILDATIASAVWALCVLFVFGVYMSRVSNHSWLISGIRMALAGVVVAFINLVLPGGG